MRMPFKQQAQMSRMDRLRCGVQSRAADASHSASHSARAVADRARPAATDAASAAQSAATSAAASVSAAANSAAHSVADAASAAARNVAARGRPLADEAATRGSAAWTVLRYGAPAPRLMGRMVGLVPPAAAGRKIGSTAKSKTGSAVWLVALGGAAAAAVMWWRRSQAGTESMWILDDADGDMEPPEGWHEGSSMSTVRADDRRSAADRLADLADADRKRSDTWP